MPDLGPREAVLAARLAWRPRRDEWIAGRAVAKAALLEAFALASWRVEILPAASGAPEVHVDGARRADLHVSISHTRRCAVAAVSLAPVGVDACDDEDGPRLPRIARRVFDDGEAEACHAHTSPETQAAVWALKEAGVKLHGGGILMPGLRSVRVESLEPRASPTPPCTSRYIAYPRRSRGGERARKTGLSAHEFMDAHPVNAGATPVGWRLIETIQVACIVRERADGDRAGGAAGAGGWVR